VRRCADGELDDAELKSITQEILKEMLAKRGKIKNPSAYVGRAAHNRVINFLKKRTRQSAGVKKVPSWIPRGYHRPATEDEPEGELEAVDPASELERGRPRLPEIPVEDGAVADSILRLLEVRYPEKYVFVNKSVKLIDFLYRLALTRDHPNIRMLLCADRTLNILNEAKREIDDMMRPGWNTPKNFGVWKFNERWGVEISRWLQDEISALFMGIENTRGLPRAVGLPTFVIDALPKLRADPIMLLLRVLYKTFKMGPGGKYGARKMIRKIILELKLREAGGVCDIFKSVSEKTNFETLRKKIYKKTPDPFYDKLAVFICEASPRRADMPRLFR
jgi:hypothetical protein